MHWVATARHVGRGDASAPPSRSANGLRQIPGVRSFGAHIGQALLGEEVFGVNFGENWISLDPDADYDETPAADRRGRRRLSRALPRGADLPRRAHRGGAHRRQGADHRPRLRRGPRRPARASRDEILKAAGASTGSSNAHTDISIDVPQVEVEVDLAKAAAVRPQARRRPPRGRHAGRRRGGRRHLPGRTGVRHRGLEHPGEPGAACTAIEHLPIDTPVRDAVRLSDVATVEVKPNPNAIERQGDSRRLDVGAAVEGRDLGSVVDRAQREARRRHVRPRLPRRGARRVPGTPGRTEPAAHVLGARRGAHPPAAADRPSAAGGSRPALPHPADGPGRWRAGGVRIAGGDPLARVARRASSPCSASPRATGSC